MYRPLLARSTDHLSCLMKTDRISCAQQKKKTDCRQQPGHQSGFYVAVAVPSALLSHAATSVFMWFQSRAPLSCFTPSFRREKSRRAQRIAVSDLQRTGTNCGETVQAKARGNQGRRRISRSATKESLQAKYLSTSPLFLDLD